MECFLSHFWYLIHTKPKEEARALTNLERQGYGVYLPYIATEYRQKGILAIRQEPLFPRYLFVQIPSGLEEQTWVPIRSTLGVSSVVKVGDSPVHVPESLIESLRALEQNQMQSPKELFSPGDRVVITQGPFTGVEAIFKIKKGSERVFVLITMLNKQVVYQCSPGEISKIDRL